MGDVTAARPPPPLDRVEPRAVGRQGPPDPPPGRSTDDRVELLVSMGSRVIPGHSEGVRGRLVAQRRQPVGDLPAPFAAAEAHAGVAGVVVNGAQALPRGRWPWGGPHDVLAPRAPQGAQGGQPADIQCVRRGPHLARLQLGARVVARRFSPASSGSGRLIGCGGRLSTRPAGCSARRTVSSATRMPGCAARSSTTRWSVHQANGSPQRRGRRRTAAKSAALAASVIADGRPGRGASCHPSIPSAR